MGGAGWGEGHKCACCVSAPPAHRGWKILLCISGNGAGTLGLPWLGHSVPWGPCLCVPGGLTARSSSWGWIGHASVPKGALLQGPFSSDPLRTGSPVACREGYMWVGQRGVGGGEGSHAWLTMTRCEPQPALCLQAVWAMRWWGLCFGLVPLGFAIRRNNTQAGRVQNSGKMLTAS